MKEQRMRADITNTLIFNTAVGSLNVGDYIISEAVHREIYPMFSDSFIVEFPTHTPVMHAYQSFRRNGQVRYADSCTTKIAAGTNLLAYDALRPWPNWNMNILNARAYKGVVLAGVGSAPSGNRMNRYTKFLYQSILSHDHVHSVRDERTADLLRDLGFQAENTGCVTLWGFTEEKCRQIPEGKPDRVVFTLTDYARDPEKDQALIDTLEVEYDEIYFWPQGAQDAEYIRSLRTSSVREIAPQLDAYRTLLTSGNIDFVGTRLHAGIFAMQHNVRALILVVDNRARDMRDSYHLNTLERDDIHLLSGMINSDNPTKLNIDLEKIGRWKSQFVIGALP
ncbi:polysaccharide pyruvyl transferase family protein [Corynebacterium variabile]|uniref:polysaccharide pyruvyl transferase family protein n=2 Tax=Corynebacterium variabile TaxID=1727 RepID=UPI003F92A095